ncbi:hypothetical protein TCON_1881 [Astathelohania contejeani]|uniref:Uncharacterized protein n=1 Tax=Astathelohania contejeani TaxID=164912 RepID=A0ABQ7HXP6_9MICR|nr:hypothetical protein TCON_1881 [Thelohania contejeani]
MKLFSIVYLLPSLFLFANSIKFEVYFLFLNDFGKYLTSARKLMISYLFMFKNYEFDDGFKYIKKLEMDPDVTYFTEYYLKYSKTNMYTGINDIIIYGDTCSENKDKHTDAQKHHYPCFSYIRLICKKVIGSYNRIRSNKNLKYTILFRNEENLSNYDLIMSHIIDNYNNELKNIFEKYQSLEHCHLLSEFDKWMKIDTIVLKILREYVIDILSINFISSPLFPMNICSLVYYFENVMLILNEEYWNYSLKICPYSRKKIIMREESDIVRICVIS